MNELELYDYELPRRAIAQYPLAQRTDARLLKLDRADRSLQHHHIRDLPDLLRPGDALVLNDSRVIPARLVGYRTATRGRWQGLYLRSDADSGLWELLSKTRGKLAPGETLTILDREARESLRLEVVARLPNGNIAVRPDVAGDAGELLERYGRVPLPPYIRDGQMIDADLQSYQTVFADERGSIAAPTAGLHFTAELLARLRDQGVELHRVTLHVGLGTFRPVSVERIEDHPMHAEWGRITAETAAALRGARERGGRIIAVGTTSVRVLETAAASGELGGWTGLTDLFIRPPYTFRAVDALLTNFHLPRSTLLMLVSAFAGRERTLAAYRTAIEEEYRFYSYGDAMLIL